MLSLYKSLLSRWGRRIDLSTLEQLFVPINIDNVHWIFIRVLFEDKTIELYDPQGRRDHTNRRYMEDMRRFLHRELHKVNQGQNGRTVMVELPEDQRPPYDVWKREWTYKDMSRQAPAQENTYDCGVFTIVSIYLLSRGLELASTTYNQRAIYSRKVREGIAHIILSRNQRQTGEGSSPSTVLGTTRRRPVAARDGQKRRRRSDSRMVPSGTRQLAALLTSHGNAAPSTHPSNKRSAASLAEERGSGNPTSQRLVPPAKKRKKRRRETE